MNSRGPMVGGRGSRVDGRSSGWRLFARTVVARAYPRLIVNVREKWWMFFDVALPLCSEPLFRSTPRFRRSRSRGR